jgi:hypothetical protein
MLLMMGLLWTYSTQQRFALPHVPNSQVEKKGQPDATPLRVHVCMGGSCLRLKAVHHTSEKSLLSSEFTSIYPSIHPHGQIRTLSESVPAH